MYLYRELYYDPEWKPFKGDGLREYFQAGIFRYDITAIKEALQNGTIVPVGYAEENVDMLSQNLNMIGLKRKHIDAADLSVPLIRIEVAPDSYLTADGAHRIAKAMKQGVDTLPDMYISAMDAYPYLTEEAAYKAFVEYWNSKTEDNKLADPRVFDTPECCFTPFRNRMLHVSRVMQNMQDTFENRTRIEIREYPDRGNWFSLIYDPVKESFFFAQAQVFPSVRCKNPQKVQYGKLYDAVLNYVNWAENKEDRDFIKQWIGPQTVKYMALVRIFSQWPLHQKPVDLSAIAEAVNNSMEAWTEILDIRTGEVLSLPNDDNEYVDRDEETEEKWEEVERSGWYIALPDEHELREVDIMRSFARDMENERIGKNLLNASYGKGLYRRFRDMLYEYGLTEQYEQYKKDTYYEYFSEWCRGNGLPHEEIQRKCLSD